VHDAGDVVAAEGVDEELLVEDAAADEGDPLGHELLEARREVVVDDGVDARPDELADDVGPDVPGTAGDQP
jgi:hypothetical protein